MKILILDDSLVHRKIIKNSIKNLGSIETLEAENGKDALEILNEAVNLIITDCNMDIMDGYEFSRKVREQNKTIPIIMMSSNNAPEDLEKAFDAGVSEYIIKPFSKEDLEQKVSKFLEPGNPRAEEEVAFVEKRKHIRFNFVLAVKHRITNTGVFLDSYCSDISLGGLRLLVAEEYKMGDTMELEIHFPEDVVEPFTVFSTVRWCLPSVEFKGKFQVGVNFTGLTEDQAAVVKQLIETEKEIKAQQ